ncbi:MAG: HD domain-containing phosphohydrolase [Candidatus Omnitrophota bacterium]|nr:PAS domain S-box protein [Candidatus Omnitrophota bacterium]
MKNTFYLNISTADDLGIGLFKYSLYPCEKFLITNYSLAQILGYPSKRDIKKVKLNDLFLNFEDKQSFLKILRRDGKVKFFETLFKSKDSNPIWVAVTASRIISQDNEEYVEGIIENISSHKEMEENLSLEQDFMQGLLDNIPDIIYFKDRQNRIVKVNRFYAQGVGLKADEIVGKTDLDFFPYEQAKKMMEDDDYVIKSGQSIVGKIERTLLPDGTWNQVITTKIPMYDKVGKIIGSMGITRDMTAYANLERERLSMLINALTVLGKALEMRDPYTFSHTRHVASIAESVGRELGWNENRLLGIRLAGELHDLGKIGIPLDILNKPGKLSVLEYSFIQEHVQKCYNLIKDIEFPFPLADSIYQHHERLDGSGYPQKLIGDSILVEARILAISDVLEAMTNHRPYREALGLKKATEELRGGCGSKYDTGIVDVIFNLIDRNNGNVFWIAS